MAVKEDYFKFPRTRHVFDAGGSGVSRDDLVMSDKECEHFLKGKTFVIEEKVDGANLGISITRNYEIKIQNRSHYVNSSSHRQFGNLDSWVEKHATDLQSILEPERHILFGEWLLAKHSIHYETLPDYFLAFDIYDKKDKCFLNVKDRDAKLEVTGISTVRTITVEEGLTKKKLLDYLQTQSIFYDGFVEGLVIKTLDASDSNNSDFFTCRAKLVRPDFLQGIEEQWTRQKFVKNRLLYY